MIETAFNLVELVRHPAGVGLDEPPPNLWKPLWQLVENQRIDRLRYVRKRNAGRSDVRGASVGPQVGDAAPGMEANGQIEVVGFLPEVIEVRVADVSSGFLIAFLVDSHCPVVLGPA